MSEDKRPNIILIMTDQQRADTIGAWGYPYVETPAMDRLVQRGVSFRYAFAPGATCIPSRAAMFTGMYAHNTGAYSFHPWAHHRTWIQDLADNGYHCVSIGKVHAEPRDDMVGFHERVVVENPTSWFLQVGETDDAWGRYLALHGHDRPLNRHMSDPQWYQKYQAVPWHLDEHLHADVFIGNMAVGWIKTNRPKKPLFLHVGFTAPHEPYDPLQRHLDLYRDKAIPAAVYRDGELDDNPPQHRAHQQNFTSRWPAESQIHIGKATAEDVENMRRHYYAKITTMDEKIGEVFDALEENGYLNNSLVLFCSDHGDMLGDHRMAYKWLMYDSVVQVPLVLWDTRQKADRREINDLVSLVDIGPTIFEAAGIEMPQRLEGHSLMPYMRGESVEPQPYVFCEDSYVIMVRSQTHKMIYYIGQEAGEFYDLQRDPDELQNVWGQAQYAGVQNQMKLALLEWLAKSCFFNSKYKCRGGEDFALRWHENDAYLL